MRTVVANSMPIELNRRTSLASGTTFLLARPGFSSNASNVDVVVVGAGVAGLSAARTLLNSGKSVVIVEALARIGGRAFTDIGFFGVPHDVGAHWLHNGRDNPYNAFAIAEGFELSRAPDSMHLFSGQNILDQQAVDELWKTHSQIESAIDHAGDAGIDI